MNVATARVKAAAGGPEAAQFLPLAWPVLAELARHRNLSATAIVAARLEFSRHAQGR